MHIKNHLAIFPVAIIVAVGLSLSSTNSAQAGGFSTDTKNLPDASVIYPSRLKIQLVDTDPEVSEHRKPKQNTIYQINVPPVPQGTTRVVQVGAPPAAAANGGSNGSGSIPIMQPSLPFAGSQSNIAPHQSLANQLPNGTSTRGLQGTLARKPIQTTPLTQAAPMAKLPVSPRPTVVAAYPSTAKTPGGGVSQRQITTTNAHGSLLSRP